MECAGPLKDHYIQSCWYGGNFVYHNSKKISLILSLKHTLWSLVRTASMEAVLKSDHNVWLQRMGLKSPKMLLIWSPKISGIPVIHWPDSQQMELIRALHFMLHTLSTWNESLPPIGAGMLLKLVWLQPLSSRHMTSHWCWWDIMMSHQHIYNSNLPFVLACCWS